MFHCWFPKGVGFLGVGCLAFYKVLDYQKSKEADRKLAQMRKEGRGYIMTKDKDGNWKKVY